MTSLVATQESQMAVERADALLSLTKLTSLFGFDHGILYFPIPLAIEDVTYYYQN